MSTELRITPSGHVHLWGESWIAAGRTRRTASCGRVYPTGALTPFFPRGARRCSICFPVQP
jgi:hypothetical protein